MQALSHVFVGYHFYHFYLCRIQDILLRSPSELIESPLEPDMYPAGKYAQVHSQIPAIHRRCLLVPNCFLPFLDGFPLLLPNGAVVPQGKHRVNGEGEAKSSWVRCFRWRAAMNSSSRIWLLLSNSAILLALNLNVKIYRQRHSYRFSR